MEIYMTLYEELYFDITFEGAKSDIKKVVSALRSGALDEFFELDDEYLDYADNYREIEDSDDTHFYLTNQDYGIEIDELDAEELLEAICRLAKNLDVHGEIYDAENEEYRFESRRGDSYFINADKAKRFNDELDAEREREEEDED